MPLPWLLQFTFAGMIFLVLPPPAWGMDKKAALEEGSFNIYVDGKEIGTERFSILFSADSASSTSVIDFRDPGKKHQRVHMETQLHMDGGFLPRTYQLRFDIEGQKGSLNGTFTPGQALFEYKGGGNPRKSGLLVGNQYFILDTNVFHHFIFLVKLFDLHAKQKAQAFEVIVPQETDSGIIRITRAGMDKIMVRGKKRNLHHLKADSGILQIDLWMDDRRVLHKLALPDKKIEIIRN